MDDRLKRDLLVRFIQIKTDKINPCARNSGIGTLHRLFDDIQENELETFLPNYILKHVRNLQTAIQTQTVELWALNLAQSVSWVFIDHIEKNFRDDILQAITPGKVRHIKHILSGYGHTSHEIEHSLCKAFISVIIQYLYMKEVPTPILHQINRALDDIDYMNSDAMTQKRKQCLIENLKLDKYNREHLQYWQDHTYLGVFKKGGMPILHLHKEYRVPTRIAAMMDAPTDHYGSYGDFKDVLDEIRTSPLGWFQGLKKKLRDDVTQEMYDIEDLDFVNLSLEEKDTNEHEKVCEKTPLMKGSINI